MKSVHSVDTGSAVALLAGCATASFFDGAVLARERVSSSPLPAPAPASALAIIPFVAPLRSPQAATEVRAPGRIAGLSGHF